MSDTPKIKVAQYHWGEHNVSYRLNREINEAYCRRHGYEHVVKTHRPRDDRSPHWEKITVMRQELDDCEYLLYLDADAFFYSHELKIEDELVPLLANGEIMMAADYACEGMRHQPDKPNTGVVLVRSGEKSAEMLRIWDESSERPEMERYRFNLFHEQDACHLSIGKEFSEDFVLLKDYYLMNGYCGIFIRHLMGKSDEERTEVMHKFIAERGDGIFANIATDHTT